MATQSQFVHTNVRSSLVLVDNTGSSVLTGYAIENNGIQDAWLKFYVPDDPTDPINTTTTGATPSLQIKILAEDSKELFIGQRLAIESDGIWFFFGAFLIRATTSPDDASTDSPNEGLIVGLKYNH